ncbi:MAG: DUF4910 domain-containing protein [Desulfurococcales archaeon]|nr:DUF4910 domain-containing protein [Desulfurococcales archaeon]
MADVANLLKEVFSIQELIKYVSDLSYFHRIQGSNEIESAGRYIYEVLKETSPLFEVRLHEFSYLKSYGVLRPITGWWVRDAELKLVKPGRKLLHNFRTSRTLVIAHSPGGEVEGKVVYVGQGDRPKHYEGVSVEGKVVLAHGTPYLVYREASRRGAAAVLLYREGRGPETAVPYIGLFLEPDEFKEARTPALSISRATANELIRYIRSGDRPVVHAKVVAGYRDDPHIPVITAKLGDAEDEVHVFAHYCHPGGTVNDNVSGSAVLLELVKTFSRVLEGSSLTPPKKHSIVFLWFPEYSGSLAYLLSRDTSNIVFGINLDMVGEKQCTTNSVLIFMRSPPSMFHPYEAVVYYEVKKLVARASPFSSPKKIVTVRFDTSPYETGSDHDMYLHLSIPAVMLNQWPDRFYHTDQDTIDKFDPEVASLIGVGVGSAAYKVSSADVSEELLRSYVLEYLGSETSWIESNYAEFRFKYLCSKLIGNLRKHYGKTLGLESLCRELGEIHDTSSEKYVYTGPPGIVELRLLFKRLPAEEYYRLEDMLSKERHLRMLLSGFIPMVLRKPMSLEELRDVVLGELGISVNENKLRVLLEVLVKSGLAEKHGT